MYCEKVELTGENVMSMLYCAKKYMVSGLETLCQEFLKTQMDPSNVCTILDQVRRSPNHSGGETRPDPGQNCSFH